MNWILATFPAPFWTTVIVIIVGAAAAIAGWSLGFDQGWDRRAARVADVIDAVPDAAEVLQVEARAFQRGCDAGVHAERERQRQVRSAAGHKATATRRNRVTGETWPALDAPVVTGTVPPGTPVALTADAGEGAE